MRHFFFVFFAWGAIYLGSIGLTYAILGDASLTNLEHIAIAITSAIYAFWFERRLFHESD